MFGKVVERGEGGEGGIEGVARDVNDLILVLIIGGKGTVRKG